MWFRHSFSSRSRRLSEGDSSEGHTDVMVQMECRAAAFSSYASTNSEGSSTARIFSLAAIAASPSSGITIESIWR